MRECGTSGIINNIIDIIFQKKVFKTYIPYTPWTPVTPPLFVGREKLLRDLANALEKRESISLVGDRRIGKTSVLETWQQQVQAQNRLVIYVTGEGSEAKDLPQFIKKITKHQYINA